VPQGLSWGSLLARHIGRRNIPALHTADSMLRKNNILGVKLFTFNGAGHLAHGAPFEEHAHNQHSNAKTDKIELQPSPEIGVNFHVVK
jgi:hypothetical protein